MLNWKSATSSESQGIGLGSSPSGGAEGVEWREPANFERLYRTYGERVYSLCMRMTGHVAEAEDLTQEAFVHLYQKLDTFRGDSAFYTWFHRLVVNLVLMRFRKRQKSRETLLEDMPNADMLDVSFDPQEVESTDSLLMGRVDRVDMQRALNALPEGFKTVFVLHDIEGYEHQEISELTGLSVGTSKSQLHKARLRMRKLLQEGLKAKKARSRVRPRSLAGFGRAVQSQPCPAS